ncbi:MAG TPA: sialidase family protein [Longimicrobium sp.]|jgi:hypothetical protein|uniref:sialidase family protein n=1 Tax=Longimicrobium sp. TaxID=2029185 RepID=UPI002EDA8279
MHTRIARSGLVLAACALSGCAQDPTQAQPAGPDAALAATTAVGASLHSGPENDYQPSLFRLNDGRLMTVFERLAPRTNSGDLYVSTSSDNGVSWSAPALIVGTRSSERHPSVVQLPSGAFALFYLVVDSKGAYTIQRATSADGRTWTARGAVSLGWGTAGDMNPSVIVEADGSLTMTYQRHNGTTYVGYLARSLDGGATWDGRRTTVTGGGQGMLPRIARRAADGLYMATYQAAGADGKLAIFAKTSADPYAWPAQAAVISTVTDSHDSQPIVLEDGRFLLMYIGLGSDAGYNLYYRTTDGAVWTAPVKVTTDLDLHDVEPHPVLHGTPGRVVLAWGRQRAPSSDFDIWVNPALDIQ